MYVFGVDLPIMELLFLFGIFLLIALAVIWLEIRRLKELILMEKANIYRFNENITKLKPKEKREYCRTLNDFIKIALERGFTKKEIRSILLKKGWPKDLVDKAINKGQN